MKQVRSLPPTPPAVVPQAAGRAGKAASPQAEGRPESSLFDEMAALHLDALYRTALRLTGRPEDAEDLVQETCLRAWRSLRTYRSGTNARAWLFKILRNGNIDRFRASSRAIKIAPDIDVHARVPVVHETPESVAMASRMDAEVSQALREVPEVFRTCLVLADLKGFSYSEIRDILGIPRGTVMSRLFRGRRAMRRLLTAYGREHGYLKAS